MYDMKALYEAESVENAVALRLEHPEAQIIAGGSDVLVQMREGKRAGKELISIYGLDELRGVSIDEDENIRIGSLSSFSHITRDPIIQKYINVLGEAVDMVGGPQIRNIGTIGGNTCNGVTSADSSSTLHAWDAIVELTGKNGVRRLPIKDFYIKAGQVDIRVEDGEIQTAILIPKASYENCYGYYIKYAMRNAMDIATLGCSVNVRLSPDKQTIERARIAYGVAGPVPMRAPSAEAVVNGQPVTMEKKVYVLLNKPKDYVTTSDDPQQRKTVMDLVKNVCPERIYPVGRLDRNTTGVLLLTNDGDLASKLTHPKFLKKKVYHVYLDKAVTATDLQKIADGIELEDGEVHADAIEYASPTDEKQVGIEIHSGKNRIVRRIFESLGYRVVKLDRVQFAGLTKKNLRRGDWRFLTQKEVEMLRMGAFE